MIPELLSIKKFLVWSQKKRSNFCITFWYLVFEIRKACDSPSHRKLMTKPSCILFIEPFIFWSYIITIFISYNPKNPQFRNKFRNHILCSFNICWLRIIVLSKVFADWHYRCFQVCVNNKWRIYYKYICTMYHIHIYIQCLVFLSYVFKPNKLINAMLLITWINS